MAFQDEGRTEAPPKEAPEKVAKAQEFCAELFERLGAKVSIEVRETAEAIGVSLKGEEGNSLELSGALVEAASGVLFALAALRFGPTLRAVLAAALFWFLLVLSAIDVDHYRLPNALVGSLAVLGLGGVLVTQFVALPLAPLVGPSGGASLLSQPLVLALIGVRRGDTQAAADRLLERVLTYRIFSHVILLLISGRP